MTIESHEARSKVQEKELRGQMEKYDVFISSGLVYASMVSTIESPLYETSGLLCRLLLAAGAHKK